MIVFQLILWRQTIVYVTETSSNMASTHSQKWLTIFCQKAQNFSYFVPNDFDQISPACVPNTCQIMYVGTLDLQCQRQVW